MSFGQKNLVRKTLQGTGTITIPGGVYGVKVYSRPRLLNKIASGYVSCHALDLQGRCYSWGAGSTGQLGDNSTTSKSSPVQIFGNHAFSKILVAGDDAGLGVVIGLKSDGTSYAWGDNFNGEFGNNAAGTTSSIPTIACSGNLFLDISLGDSFGGGLKDDGTIWCWGDGSSGKLGNNTTTNVSSPVQVVGQSDFIQITDSGRFSHFSAVKSDGTVWCWGSNFPFGQLGNNSTSSTSSPVQVVGQSDFVQVACGSANTYALKTDGTVWAWGYNGTGQLGNNTNTSTSSPVQVLISDVVQISSAEYSGNDSVVMFLKDDGTVWTCGFGDEGILGNNTTTSVSSPVQVVGQSDFYQIHVSGSFGTNSCTPMALKTDGTVWAWGEGGNGKHGDNTTTDTSSPVQVLGSFFPLTIDSNTNQLKEYNLSLTPGSTYNYQTGSYSFFGDYQTYIIDKDVKEFIVEYFA